MIAVEADPSWWDRIAGHPEVAPHIFMGLPPFSLAGLLGQPGTVGLRSENGGCIFIPRDPLGLVVEMHAMFLPEGWGREVALATRAFMAEVLKTAALIVTHEQEGNWRTRPPKSHGWTPCADFKDVGLPRQLRLWALSREGWMNSVVGRKSCR